MSQHQINANFAKYLELTSQQTVSELTQNLDALALERNALLASDAYSPSRLEEIGNQYERTLTLLNEHREYIAKFQEDLQSGFCHGYAVCFGAMGLMGKRRWWQEVLIAIHNWDLSPAALDQEVIISDTESGKFKTLRELFEIAINYIVYHQGRIQDKAYNDYLPSRMNQHHLLYPKAAHQELPFFEMLDQHGNVQTIQQYYTIVGHFTSQALKSILTPELLHNAMCLIGKAGHVLHVNYSYRGSLIIYDSNFSHVNAEEITQEYSIDEGFNFIFETLGTHSLIIKLATPESAKYLHSPVYEQLLEEMPPSLLNGKGLLFLGKYYPEKLDCVFNKARQETSKGQAMRQVIANALQQKLGSLSGLHYLLQGRPEWVDEVIRMALHAHDSSVLLSNMLNVVRAIMTKNLLGKTGWDLMTAKLGYATSKSLIERFKHQISQLNPHDLHAFMAQTQSILNSQKVGSFFTKSKTNVLIKKLYEQAACMQENLQMQLSAGLD